MLDVGVGGGVDVVIEAMAGQEEALIKVGLAALVVRKVLRT